MTSADGRVDLHVHTTFSDGRNTPEEMVRAASEAAMVMRQASAPVAVPIAATPLFTDFADKWYDEREVDWKRSTRLKVADILRKHLNPRFKGRRVGEITKEDILSLRIYLDNEYRDGRGLSNSRINLFSSVEAREVAANS